jgi:hypothetical protein
LGALPLAEEENEKFHFLPAAARVTGRSLEGSEGSEPDRAFVDGA